MPELFEVLRAKRESEYEHKKFLAAMQGVDLEKNSSKGQEEWERIKAKAFSKGKISDPNDIVSLQGHAAKRAGFGIGEGLDYEEV
jgi:hypothetical protein